VSTSGAFVSIESAKKVVMTGEQSTVATNIGSVDSVSVGGSYNSFNGGDAGSVEVSGSNSQVVVTSASTVTVTGDGNFVTWTSGPAAANDTGVGNTIVAP
jgi:ribosomal protein L13